MSDLLPCPFCGGTPYKLFDDDGKWSQIACNSCGTRSHENKRIEPVIAAWNRRISNWQPIETAPSEKRVLVRVPIDNHRLVIAFKNSFGLWLDERMQPMHYPPTEWQMLPD